MKNKDQILLEQVYSKILNENLGTGYEVQTGGANTRIIDEINIGNDVYSVSYDVDLTRSVEQHGTFYDEPKIDIIKVSKYDPQIDDSVDVPLQTLDKDTISKIESAIYADVDSDIDNSRYDFGADEQEPDHEDI
jgi:hypothetical protein